jgi:hypothetical protein
MWSRRAVCRGPDGVYFLGRDGIYVATPGGVANITNAQLYPLFPHDGQPASSKNELNPVDMTKTNDMRLTYGDGDVYFTYIDNTSAQVTLRYEIANKRWFPHSYADKMSKHYLVEASEHDPSTMKLLVTGKDTGLIFASGGNQDFGRDINVVARTPSLDGGDERAQKLYVDQMVEADGVGTLHANVLYNSETIAGPTFTAIPAGPLQQFLENISSLSVLDAYRNIAVSFAWTGGPAGPRLFAWETSGYLQPYISTKMVTQINNLGFPGWKHHRRLYAGYISNSDLLFRIQCQDGRIYGPYTLPTTSGRFRIMPQMLDHGIKDLAFGYELDGQAANFALFPEAFTIETKDWVGPEYIDLAVFKA